MTDKPACTAPLPHAARAFVRGVTRWFGREAKDYPWRRTGDPYAVLVSEMMLQQTQVATVLGRGYYVRWLEAFPDVRALAAAGEEEVLRQWEGLGYYSRARNLHRAAKVIAGEHGGVFPRDLEVLRSLPGVGRYTAGAVASFAFDLPEPAVDGNIARVLARVFDMREAIDRPAGQARVWEIAASLVPRAGGRVFNSALMELGQQVCSAKRPACGRCPVARFCATRTPEALPVKGRGRPTEARDEFSILALRGGRILLHREPARRRGGLWRLPERTREAVAGQPLALRLKYSITRYRVTLHVHLAPGAGAGEDERWHALSALGGLPMPSPYRRALGRLGALLGDGGGGAAPGGGAGERGRV